MHEQWTKKWYGNHCTVQFCTVQFCFEIKHVMALFWKQANKYACLGISECKMFGWSHAPVTFVDVLWSLFHLLKGMSVRMEHATASSASSDAVELRLQELRSSAVTRGREWLQDALAKISVKIVRSCRDIGEMQWNRCHPCHHDIELVFVESFTAFTCCFLDAIILSLCLCTFAIFKHFHCNYVCAPLFATEVIHGIMVPSLFGMSNSGVVFSVSKWKSRCFALDCALYIPWLRCERIDKMRFATRDVTFVGEAVVDISKPGAFN